MRQVRNSEDHKCISRGDVIYHIFIDRFSGFARDADDALPVPAGGTIAGAAQRIPYLKDLGVSAVLLSPFCQSISYHGYDITNFYRVDPRFGAAQDLKRFVTACHRKDIRVIADFVCNHCSCRHPFFQKARSDRKSKYRDWFEFTRWPDRYRSYNNISDLPRFNHRNPEVVRYFTANALYWVERFGFDGLRLDHAAGPSLKFWRSFAKGIRARDDRIFLFGEVWDSDEIMGRYCSVFDGCFDFTFNALIRNYIALTRCIERELRARLNAHYRRFPRTFLLPTFLDNHDMPRFFSTADGSTSKIKRAARIQFSIDQPKIIYYGTEVGITQNTKAASPDLGARRKMLWDPQRQNHTLLKFYKTLIKRGKSG